MDYINLTADVFAEIRGTDSAIPKLVTESCTINFEAMTEVEKLMHKLIDELDTKALELCITEGISLEEAREKMNGYVKEKAKTEINSIYGLPENLLGD